MNTERSLELQEYSRIFRKFQEYSGIFKNNQEDSGIFRNRCNSISTIWVWESVITLLNPDPTDIIAYSFSIERSMQYWESVIILIYHGYNSIKLEYREVNTVLRVCYHFVRNKTYRLTVSGFCTEKSVWAWESVIILSNQE